MANSTVAARAQRSERAAIVVLDRDGRQIDVFKTSDVDGGDCVALRSPGNALALSEGKSTPFPVDNCALTVRVERRVRLTVADQASTRAEA